MPRIFLGIDLPKDLKLKIEDLKLKSNLQQLPIKLVEKENSHIAIKFLDELTDEQIDLINQRLAEAIGDFKRFPTQIQNSLVFPNLAKPRVLGLKVISPNLEGLAKKIFLGFAGLDFVLPEERKYLPHITLGRVKDNLSSGEIEKISNLEFSENFFIDEIQLFESQLTDSGPIYSVLKRFPLK